MQARLDDAGNEATTGVEEASQRAQVERLRADQLGLRVEAERERADAAAEELDELRQHVVQLEADRQRTREQVAQLEAARDAALEQGRAAVEAVAELEAKAARTEQLVQETLDELDREQRRVREEREARDELERARAAEKKNADEAEKKLADELAHANERLAELTTELRAATAARAEIEGRLATAEAEIARAAEHAHTLEDALTAAEVRTRKTIEELSSEMKQASEQLEEAEQERDRADQRASQAALKLERVQIESDALVERALGSVERRAEEHNRELLEELESFSASLSRDLLRPLRVIEGFCKGLEDQWSDHLDDDGRRWLARARRNHEQLGELVADLSALSRSARREIDRSPVDLSGLAAEIVAELRSRSPEKQPAVTIAPGIGAAGDRELLREALQALLRHAWRYTAASPEGEIVFSSEDRAGEHLFLVRDNGAVIEPTKDGSVLDLTRHGVTSADDRGSPLSLAKALRIVRRHGGRMWAESGIEQGGTVYFTLRPKD
jgi:signal transduction histidine kinase